MRARLNEPTIEYLGMVVSDVDIFATNLGSHRFVECSVSDRARGGAAAPCPIGTLTFSENS